MLLFLDNDSTKSIKNCESLKGGSINYRRKVFCMLDSLRFVILRPLFGSICLFVQSYSPLYSFTHKQIDHKNSLAI